MSEEADEVQVDDTRKAFFAGAVSVYELLMKIAPESEDREELAKQTLQDLETELKQYSAQLDRAILDKPDH